MHTFEDDLAIDDFEVEITDLEPENESRPISAAIAVQFFSALKPLHARLPRKERILRLAIVGIAILSMFGVVLGGLPSARDAVLSLFPRPTPAPAPASTSTARKFRRFRGSPGVIISLGDISISLTPIAGATVIPWNPNTSVSNVLGPVPQNCSSANVPQGPDSGNLPYGNRVGMPPLWVTGFEGIPARLTGFTRASPELYGWVHQITLMLESNADEPVMLQGANLMNETPLLFGDPDSEQILTTFLTLNLDTSSVSSDSTDLQWGIRPVSLYIPTAGCYYLKASWSGGSWEAIFAAGE